MKAGELRRQNILNDLKNNDCCTYEYLMETYQISERSMQLDIKELCKQGHQIKGVKAKRGYILKKDDSGVKQEYFEASDAQKIRKLFIMLILQNSTGYSTEEVVKELRKYNCDSVSADIKTIQTALDELVTARMVVCENKKYIISTMAPIQLALSTTEALELLNLLESCTKGHHYESVLNEIRKKFTIALFNEPEEENTSSAYVVYNKKYEEAGKLALVLEELNQYPFENKKLRIIYEDYFGEQIDIIFSVGNVVYSVEKDRIYLLGETEGKPIIIHYASIKSMEACDEENIVFQNEFYRKITDSMFGISIEPAVHVKVEFDNRFQIKDKVSRLLQNRPQASLEVQGDCFIYEDDVSGLMDFARFLRRFGYNCRVMEPKELRDIMQESANRILCAYARLEDGNEGNE